MLYINSEIVPMNDSAMPTINTKKTPPTLAKPSSFA